MKTLSYFKIKIAIIMKNLMLKTFFLAILLSACDPNKELFDTLDDMQVPHNEAIEYVLTGADYSFLGGIISSHNAFNDTLPAKDYVPIILSRNFLALNLGSSALVTYNHLLIYPEWWDSGFGYVLTSEDYKLIGQGESFSYSNPASVYLPTFLEIISSEWGLEPEEGDRISIIYNFNTGEEIILNLDIYEFDGGSWIWIETTEDIPYAGYELKESDYQNWEGYISNNNSFNEDYPPENYLPVFLRNKFPYAVNNDEQVIKYRYNDGSGTNEVIDKYIFDGIIWSIVPYIEERTEQYVFGDVGWAFDPTVTHLMRKDDYTYIATIDPIPHPVFDDFGYYYGASGFYSNFDVRLYGRRLNKDDDGNYYDPALAEIFENEGEDAAMDEIYRRIVEEAFIYFLQYFFPDATPQVGGVDVHYIVQFETFGDNWIRTYPEAEYICVAAGDPPQFELIDGPRDRQ